MCKQINPELIDKIAEVMDILSESDKEVFATQILDMVADRLPEMTTNNIFSSFIS